MGMDRSPRIPTELWYEVLSYLLKRDQLQYRLVSREWSRIALPFCFETLQFGFDADSISNLVQVARRKEFARHVQKLVLRNSRKLPEFDSFVKWKDHISLPGDPSRDSRPLIGGSEYEKLMPYQEWLHLSDNEKEAVYQVYEADRKRMDTVYETYGMICNKWKLDTPEFTQFKEALVGFSNLRTFSHTPRAMFEEFMHIRWRQLRIQGGALIAPISRNGEENEALQLSIVLNALGCTEQSHPKLRSISFYTLDLPFWDPGSLPCLWQKHGIIGDIRDVDKTYTLEEGSLHNDPYARQLANMKQALAGLTHLSCIISEVERISGPLIAIRPIFDFIRHSENLERVHLTFGRLKRPPFILAGGSYSILAKPHKLLDLLATHRPWSKLRELELRMVTTEDALLRFLVSLAPTLRHLSLTNITLRRNDGMWASALPRIASSLDLDVFKLFRLYDYGPQGETRLYFSRRARVWSADMIPVLEE